MKDLIENLLKEQRKSKIELADYIGKTRQGLDYKLKVDSFDREELEQMASFFGVNVNNFFASSVHDTQHVKPTKADSIGDYFYNKILEEIKSLKEQLSTKDRQIDKLLDIISQPRNFHNPAAGAGMKVLRSEPQLELEGQLGS